MTDASENGYPVIWVITDAQLKQWKVPGTDVIFPLRRSDPGFILTFVADWLNTDIEKISGKGDDFGWALRRITGSDKWSNHASGTAIDLNSSTHPQGVFGTFKKAWKTAKIKLKMATTFEGLVTWGGSWSTPDEMHFEITFNDEARVHELAQKLRKTARGDRIQLLNR